MAPRRLVLAMIFLLAVSTVIAVIAPDPAEREPAERERSLERDRTQAASPSSGSSDGSDGVDRRPDQPVSPPVAPKPRSIEVGGPVEVLRGRPGSRLVLEVRSSGTAEIAIPELGRVSTSDRFAPAVFDLVLPNRRERFEVVDLEDGRAVGRIVVD